MAQLYAVITGDIVHSRRFQRDDWYRPLRDALEHFGSEPMEWMVFRGDSFQLLLAEPEKSLFAVLAIKAALKSHKGLDARMAIGIGPAGSLEKTVTESSGEAFIHSGHCFDSLKGRRLDLACESVNPEFDELVNPSLALLEALCKRWLPSYANIMYHTLCYPDYTQKQLGDLLGIAQNTVSERQSRAEKSALTSYESLFQALVLKHFYP